MFEQECGRGDSVHSLVTKGLSEILWFSWNGGKEWESLLKNNGMIFFSFWTLEILRQGGKAMKTEVARSLCAQSVLTVGAVST